MGMAVPIYWTADMVRALPDDGKQYETVYGELLVSPAPRPWHEVVAGRLVFAPWRLCVRQSRAAVALSTSGRPEERRVFRVWGGWKKP